MLLPRFSSYPQSYDKGSKNIYRMHGLSHLFGELKFIA